MNLRKPVQILLIAVSALYRPFRQSQGAKGLALFSLIGVLLVEFSGLVTQGPIEANASKKIARTLNEVLPGMTFDSPVLKDPIAITDVRLQGQPPLTVYRLKREGQIVAYFLKAKAMGGYGGDIDFALALDPSLEILGIRVLKHHETPGLGDRIEVRRSGWIHAFEGKSLGHPEDHRWEVQKDGGDFDQFVGATVTPRALVRAARTTLEILASHADEISLKGNTPR